MLTLIGFGGIGLLSITLLQGISLVQLLNSGASLPTQLIWGTSFGLGAALLALAMVQAPWFNFSQAYFTNLIKSINPSIPEILLYSFCAGVGEELLFRGGIQSLFSNPILGIWITSVIFIALHGYLSITDLELTLYGILMVFVSAGMGYLLLQWGIYASMAAHFIFDVVMFLFLMYGPSEPDSEA